MVEVQISFRIRSVSLICLNIENYVMSNFYQLDCIVVSFVCTASFLQTGKYVHREGYTRWKTRTTQLSL